MRIRTKLMLSMSVLLVFILLFLLAATHIQFYIARDYAYREDKASFEALREEFQRYYADHGRSWERAGTFEFDRARGFAEVLLYADGVPLYRQGHLRVDELRNDGYPLVIRYDGQKAGRLYVMNDEQLKTYEFKKMWYRFLPNVGRASLLFTGLAALLTIWILSWRLTRPVRRIVQGIESIQQGNESASFPIRRKDEFGEISKALRDMNESLAKAERARKQLLSDVAHELRTPLMIVQGELELAQETGDTLSPDKQSSILDEVYRLSRLVHEVLDLSKLEAGMTELRPGEENLSSLLEELADKIRFLAEDKQIRLTLDGPEEEVRVSVEKPRILQALYNLLTNAIYYTNPGGQIRVSLERAIVPDKQRPYARIRIEDSGVGIPEADLPHIFDRFYRADHARARPSGGTGLGLAIAQQNVLAHQGWIDVRSVVGKGSEFAVYLPVLPSSSQD
ncbi:HAMP domain-containing histidine kinase [Cohnella xylanilytica]|uniref:histidine kinase n=1 Tax=Cohnella xylanilytica TaxID=557555 RepID=A0A841U3I3_9BACL|nr:HAMP domain-containing sensor histidine kinase [Cohnella xylanilytica]MBB6695287.1 HAMP domain-containing histidine kinase [Cohnella xylanilytica]